MKIIKTNNFIETVAVLERGNDYIENQLEESEGKLRLSQRFLDNYAKSIGYSTCSRANFEINGKIIVCFRRSIAAEDVCVMTHDRAMCLLSEIVEHITVAKKTGEAIEELFRLGFTDDELIDVFNFSKTDVEEVVKIIEEA